MIKNKMMIKNKTNIFTITLNTFIILFMINYLLRSSSMCWIYHMEDIHMSSDAIIYFFIFLFVPSLFGGIFYYLYKINYIQAYFIGFVIQWIIFLNVNPYPIQNNNKLSIMKSLPKKNIPSFQKSLTTIYKREKEEIIPYPIIIKPIFCSGDGKNIRLIQNEDELKSFLNKNNENDIKNFMVQNYLNDSKIELGVLYEKLPFAKKGRIIEIVEKKLIHGKINNNDEKGVRIFHTNYLQNQYKLINNKTNDIFNKLSENITELNVGRYDIRLKRLEDLEKGYFKIVELNGTMGMRLMNYNNISWYLSRFVIGLYNIFTLQGYSPIHLPIIMYKSLYSMTVCHDWENLYSLYS